MNCILYTENGEMTDGCWWKKFGLVSYVIVGGGGGGPRGFLTRFLIFGYKALHYIVDSLNLSISTCAIVSYAYLLSGLSPHVTYAYFGQEFLSSKLANHSFTHENCGAWPLTLRLGSSKVSKHLILNISIFHIFICTYSYLKPIICERICSQWFVIHIPV
jgi:hypothetical protein